MARASAPTPALGGMNGRNNSDIDSRDYDFDLVYHDSSVQPTEPLPSRREEAWRRRWRQAQEILDRQGVVLGRWRVGSDVQDITVWLVKEAQKNMLNSQKKDKKFNSAG